MLNLQESNCKSTGIKSLVDNKLAANNQCVKAIAISSGHLGQAGQSLLVKIGFTSVMIDDQEKSVMLYYPVLQ